MTVMHIKGEGLFEAITGLESMEPSVKRGVVRTVRKVTKSSSKSVASRIAKATRLPVRTLTQGGGARRGKRVHQYFSRDGMDGFVWVGYNPVKAAYVGRLTQQVRGARAGRHTYPGGFVATMRSGHQSIFQRTQKSRLPIEEKDVSMSVAPVLVQQETSRIQSRLSDVLLQEINYEFNVKGN
ncbi:MAG: phage tail protein [Candidatus Thiodiazotropha sp. (ex Monitilora ramsayi)]|nr:phage tail protein [Candidatus Thiodiazotropha sp. (ex Monitilora ramsayi)]